VPAGLRRIAGPPVARLIRQLADLRRKRGAAEYALTGARAAVKQAEGASEWGPGRVPVSWRRYHCAGAQTLHEDQAIWGHVTVACPEQGCRPVWYDPPHKPGPQG
jgi:hypothetical protein